MATKYPMAKSSDFAPTRPIESPESNHIGLKTLAGAAIAGVALSVLVNYMNQNSEEVAYGARELAGERTATVKGGKFTLEPGAIVRANPVVTNGSEFNSVCVIGNNQDPVSIKTKTVTLADGVKTNPNDPNGPWVMIDLDKLPTELQDSCAPGIERDQDGKGWVSVEGGKVTIHTK